MTRGPRVEQLLLHGSKARWGYQAADWQLTKAALKFCRLLALKRHSMEGALYIGHGSCSGFL